MFIGKGGSATAHQYTQHVTCRREEMLAIPIVAPYTLAVRFNILHSHRHILIFSQMLHIHRCDGHLGNTTLGFDLEPRLSTFARYIEGPAVVTQHGLTTNQPYKHTFTHDQVGRNALHTAAAQADAATGIDSALLGHDQRRGGIISASKIVLDDGVEQHIALLIRNDTSRRGRNHPYDLRHGHRTLGRRLDGRFSTFDLPTTCKVHRHTALARAQRHIVKSHLEALVTDKSKRDNLWHLRQREVACHLMPPIHRHRIVFQTAPAFAVTADPNRRIWIVILYDTLPNRCQMTPERQSQILIRLLQRNTRNLQHGILPDHKIVASRGIRIVIRSRAYVATNAYAFTRVCDRLTAAPFTCGKSRKLRQRRPLVLRLSILRTRLLPVETVTIYNLGLWRLRHLFDALHHIERHTHLRRSRHRHFDHRAARIRRALQRKGHTAVTRSLRGRHIKPRSSARNTPFAVRAYHDRSRPAFTVIIEAPVCQRHPFGRENLKPRSECFGRGSARYKPQGEGSRDGRGNDRQSS